MARGSSSSKRDEAKGAMDPEIAARKRLKKLAFTNNILSETQAKPQAYLSPSATVLKHHGKDIVKKSQRKNRFLFSFSGLLAPVSGGKIGELKDLGTKNPILYLDFPQVRLFLLCSKHLSIFLCFERFLQFSSTFSPVSRSYMFLLPVHLALVCHLHPPPSMIDNPI